jgi:hypothetical protein
MPGARPVGEKLQPRTFENGSLEVEATICFGGVGPPIGRTCTPSGTFGKGGLLRLLEERTEMHGWVDSSQIFINLKLDTRTIGEDDLHSLLLQLHGSEIQLTTHGVLRAFDRAIEQVRV